MNLSPDELSRRARRIRVILTDCDGVLTDGRLYYAGDSCAEPFKVFHIHDGLGLRLAARAGLKIGIISGRESRALIARGRELGVHHLYCGSDEKLVAYKRILLDEGASEAEVAYIGDDLPDLPLLTCVGLAVAVADAVEEVRTAAHYVTARAGGTGAVREVVELILKAQGLWDGLIDEYRA